jgi:hypothetical protein
MANPKLPQTKAALTVKPAEQYTYGLTESQLRVLSNIRDAADGLGAAMNHEEHGGADTCPEREIFKQMAEAVWAAASGLHCQIERHQKLGGGQ